MRSRGLVVAIAVVLAVLAAVGVIVYTNQVRTQVEVENTVPVIVSNQDIPANTNLDPLIADGAFEFVRVPENALVADAVTTEEQLTGRTTTAPIFAREQITESRLSGGESPLSVIGVSEGHLGLTVALDAPRAGGGIVQQGDSVAVFATWEEGSVVTKEGLRRLLSPGQIQRFFGLGEGASDPSQADFFALTHDVTVMLVPSAQVLRIQNPTVDETGRQDEGGLVQMSLDILPEDARSLVFASETTDNQIWVGLLPPSEAEEGYPIEGQVGIDYDRLVGVVRS